MFYLTRDIKPTTCELFYGKPDFLDGRFEPSETSEHIGDITCRTLANLGIFLDPGEVLELELSVEDIIASAFGLATV